MREASLPGNDCLLLRSEGWSDEKRLRHPRVLAGAILYLNLLPDRSNSQTIILSCLHMLFFLWSLVGIGLPRGGWRNLSGRMEYIRYNGELLIYCTIILIGGAVLSGLTLALFGLIDLKIADWYMRNVAILRSDRSADGRNAAGRTHRR